MAYTETVGLHLMDEKQNCSNGHNYAVIILLQSTCGLDFA